MDWVNRPTFQQVVEYRLDAQSPDSDGDGRNDQCNGQDANAVKRAALGQSSPTFGPHCHNATGEPVPPGL